LSDAARPPLAAVALISGATLGCELVLMRLLSVVQWHHYAAMIISVALLGFGASGAALTLARARALAAARATFALNAVAFGLCVAGCLALAARVPFNPLELAWDPRQPLWLLAVYLLLAVPFFFAGNCIGVALMSARAAVPRVYAADLAGAAGGSLGVTALLFVLAPHHALKLLAVLGPLAGAAAAGRVRPRLALVCLALGGVLALAPDGWLRPTPSPYKALSQALRVPGARVEAERFSPVGWVSAVASPQAPFRHAPGLSLRAPGPIPEQRGLYSDAEGPSVVTRFDGRLAPLEYLEWSPAALGYALVERPRVLVLGAGGGTEVLRALRHRAPSVDAVEIDPRVVELVRGRYRRFSGGLYAGGRVRAHVAEGRSFVAASGGAWDLIQIAPLGSRTASLAGLHGAGADYLLTVEAFEDYLAHLAPEGVLALGRWTRLPPRDGVKVFATALRALARAGAGEPAAHVAWIRGLNTSTVVVSRAPLGAAAVRAVRSFARSRGFDLVHLPGMADAEANRYNVLERPWFREAATALTGPHPERYLARYKFDVRPATDDRPYFADFFRWRSLPELLALRQQGGAAQLELGYLVLAATLVQALLAGAVLVLLPLAALARGGAATAGPGAVLGYFLAIGLAFLMLEIALIEHFTRYLGHPVYAVAVVLTAFLGFAGLGSALAGAAAGGASAPGRRPRSAAAGAGLACAGVVLAGALLAVVLPALFAATAHWPAPGRAVAGVAVLAPLACLMGMPFPLGLRATSEAAPALVPWAWGINGCASVVSAVLAALLAVELGLQVVVGAALALYALAGLTARARLGRGVGAGRA